MKRILVLSILLSFAYMQDECSEITNPYECYDMGCEWIISYEEIDNELILNEGCFDQEIDEENWEDDSECYGLGYEDCEYLDFCEWIMDSDDPTGNGFCVDVNDNWEDNDCNPDLACATVITCYEGLLYPTSCGPENCDESIGECDDNFDGCQSDNGEWYDIGHEMFINDCEYYECTLNGWVGPFELDECGEQDWECSDLSQDECASSEECEWVTDSDNPNSWGSCVETGNNNGGPPECVMDCEGIEDVSPEDDATYFCNWLLDTFPSGCAEDCEQDVLNDIEEFMIVCDVCLADNNCDGIFDDNYEDGCFENGEWYGYGQELFINECEYYECTEDGWQGPFELDGCEDNTECSELNYPECIDTEGCEWIISNEWGGYSCVESNDEDNCSDLGYEDCLESPNCQPNYNAAGQFEGCEEFNNQPNFGFLYGTVSYIYGDVVDFVPYATLYIESAPSNADIYSFEVMTDGEGYYQIELPSGAYIVTAYAEEESLTQDAWITPNAEVELNFLLGDWYGPWNPYAYLSLGEDQAVSPGSDVLIPLYLSSTELVGGVQFTIGASDVLYPISIESTDPCFSADFNMLDDDQVIGILFSLEGCTYPPEEMLEIAHLVFNVSAYFPVGIDIEVFFNYTIVSDSIGGEIPSYGEGMTISLGSLGDVNGDGEHNVLDVVLVIAFALYAEYPSDYEFWASDINSDGFINVLDIVALVNLILDD